MFAIGIKIVLFVAVECTHAYRKGGGGGATGAASQRARAEIDARVVSISLTILGEAY